MLRTILKRAVAFNPEQQCENLSHSDAVRNKKNYPFPESRRIIYLNSKSSKLQVFKNMYFNKLKTNEGIIVNCKHIKLLKIHFFTLQIHNIKIYDDTL